MNMAVLRSVGLGCGAVAAAVPTVVGAVLCGQACKMTWKVVRGDRELFDKPSKAMEFLVKNNQWQMVCLCAIAVVASAMLSCSFGYVSFWLAKAAWLKIGVPSLIIPLGIAFGGGVLIAAITIRVHMLTNAAKANLGRVTDLNSRVDRFDE